MAADGAQNVDAVEVVDSISDTVENSSEHAPLDAFVGKDGNCGNEGLKPMAAARFIRRERLSVLHSMRSSQSLPSLIKNHTSVRCTAAPSTSLISLRDGVSSSAKIPTVCRNYVEDSRISASVSSLPRNTVMSDTATVKVTCERVCRICQLTGDSVTMVDCTLISPCRCTGSVQYTHTACLVVSSLVSAKLWFNVQSNKINAAIK